MACSNITKFYETELMINILCIKYIL